MSLIRPFCMSISGVMGSSTSHCFEILKVHNGIFFPEYIREPPLRDPPLKGHLSAFKTGALYTARAGLLSLMPFPGGLA